jgi:hypothetical protein
VAELRSFIFLSRLQPQTMCYLGTWIRGSLPRSHVAAQVVEIAPGLARIKLVDYRMIGATGRLYLSGTEADMRQAAEAAEGALRDLT